MVAPLGWYDQDFVRAWTNAPHLVRSDTGRLLRSADLAGGGDVGHFVAWNGLAGQPVAYDPATGRYGTPVDHLTLEGEVMVAAKLGMLPCRPVFAHYAHSTSPSGSDWASISGTGMLRRPTVTNSHRAG
jgi:hypothetical protein